MMQHKAPHPSAPPTFHKDYKAWKGGVRLRSHIKPTMKDFEKAEKRWHMDITNDIVDKLLAWESSPC